MNEETEQIPTFLVVGDEIVDVLFTGWRPEFGLNSVYWTMSEPHERVDLPKGLERVVFELPIGCFEMPLHLSPGSTLAFTAGGEGDVGMDLYVCRHKPTKFAEEVQSEDTSRVAE